MAAPLISPHDAVQDDEVLFRATRPSYIQIRDGRFVISARAFSDARQEISVDRAILQNENPFPTLQRLQDADGVVSITARQVRDLAPIEHTFKDEKGREIRDEQGITKTASCGVDVRPDPFPPEQPDNASHALILGQPPFPHQKMFRIYPNRERAMFGVGASAPLDKTRSRAIEKVSKRVLARLKE